MSCGSATRGLSQREIRGYCTYRGQGLVLWQAARASHFTPVGEDSPGGESEEGMQGGFLVGLVIVLPLEKWKGFDHVRASPLDTDLPFHWQSISYCH